MSNLAKLEDLKIDIRSLLVARNSKDITLQFLNKLYKDMTDEDIPYTDFNYTSLRQFLASMPEVLRLEKNKKNELCAYHIETEKSKHISSLVSRERKDPIPQRRHNRNVVAPSLLTKFLSELCNNTTASRGENKRVKKTDVLSRIIEENGEYSFYDEQDLNSQLSELNHILYYTDEYIYFKNGVSRDRVKKKTNNKTKDACSTNSMNKQFKEFTRDSSVGDLIRQSTIDRLQQLVEKYPEGIRLEELAKLYQREFKLDVESELKAIGFNDIIEVIAALPDILQIVMPPGTRKYYVLDARIPADSHEHHQTSILTCENEFLETSDKAGALPTKLVRYFLHD